MNTENCNNDTDANIQDLENINNYITSSCNDIKLLVVIMTCNKNFHLWESLSLKTKNCILFTGYTENLYYKDKKILYLNVNDNYEGLPEKVIMMIDQILKKKAFHRVTHILKIDDHDTYFDNQIIKNIKKCIELTKYDYIGQKINKHGSNRTSNYHFNKVSPDCKWHNTWVDVSNVQYCDGGCSYILSRKAMQIINNHYNSNNINDVINNEIYEDVMIGRILNKNNIYPYEMNYSIIGDK